jgi:ECF transporter S component (folate family)
MKRTYTVVLVGLLISMEIVLTRFFQIETPIVRLGFGFLPMSVAAILFGPIGGGAMCALSDFLGVMMFPRGPFFAGLTFSALLTGAVYGVFLNKKPITILRIFFMVLTVNLLIDLGLNSYWLSILMRDFIAREGFRAFILTRVTKCAVMIPVQTFTVYYAWRFLGKYIQSSVLPKIGFDGELS